ncbi:O-antigen ligase family protein [Sporosarcina ureilytica]|uniref:O-antigen ligase-related domain-containing protein n=1 Tax=Sporosarcina ureilytica TaxID=298596 RepID=A0A1D8JJ95_9BACL|nr:O-antigen ligase family protein [Sporosarcina ureilytica]AOV08783.1 hypothetical protein BI350_15345 [Sporosarcina ureilytica]
MKSNSLNNSFQKKIAKGFKLVFSFEFIFMLFLFAGRFKGDSRFEWVPVDITLLFLLWSIVIAAYILIKRKFVFERKSLILLALYLAFSFYALITLLWSPSQVYAYEKTLHMFTLVLWALAGPALIIIREKVRLKRFFISVLLMSLWLFIESLIFVFAGNAGFINVLGGNYLGVGRTLSLGIIILTSVIFYTGIKFRVKVLLVILLAAYIYIMLSTGGRGPLLSLFPLVLIFYFASYIKTKKNLKITKKAIFSIVSMFTLFITILVLLSTDKVPQSLKRMMLLFGSDDLGASANTRVYFYKESFLLWTKNPLLGNGIGSWPVLIGSGDSRGYAHNIILEIISELGVIGLILFLTLIFYSSRKYFFHISRNFYNMTILILFLSMLVNAMVSGDISDNRFLFTTIALMLYKSPDIADTSINATNK